MSAITRERVAFCRYFHRVVPFSDRARLLEVYQRAEWEGRICIHVLPLDGRDVSGLHVAENLMLISHEEKHKYWRHRYGFVAGIGLWGWDK